MDKKLKSLSEANGEIWPISRLKLKNCTKTDKTKPFKERKRPRLLKYLTETPLKINCTL